MPKLQVKLQLQRVTMTLQMLFTKKGLVCDTKLGPNTNGPTFYPQQRDAHTTLLTVMVTVYTWCFIVIF